MNSKKKDNIKHLKALKQNFIEAHEEMALETSADAGKIEAIATRHEKNMHNTITDLKAKLHKMNEDVNLEVQNRKLVEEMHRTLKVDLVNLSTSNIPAKSSCPSISFRI